MALRVGEQLAVRLVDASTASSPENRALTPRDTAGNLLLAADPALQGALLSNYVLSRSNSAYRSTSCTLKSLMPYVLVNRRVTQTP